MYATVPELKREVTIENEKHILQVINDLNNGPYNKICSKVIDTMINCYNTNSPSRNFIFAIDGSNSISTKEFEGMKRTLKSMLNYPLNGHNYVSVMEFSGDYEQRILCQNVFEAKELETCLYNDKSGNFFGQYKGWTSTDKAIDFIENNLLTPYRDNVIVYVTDGVPNGEPNGISREEDVCPKAESLLINYGNHDKKKLTAQIAFGIGDAFDHSDAKAYLECLSIGSDITEKDNKIEDFSMFEAMRLDYQNTVCKAGKPESEISRIYEGIIKG